MERVDADGPGFSIFSFYCRRGDGLFIQFATEARRVTRTTPGARAVARAAVVRARPVLEWPPQSLSLVVVAGLWRAAADCHLLCDYGDSRLMVGPARMDNRDRRVSGRVLGLDALRARAGIRGSDTRHATARSRPQPCRLARSQAADGTPV